MPVLIRLHIFLRDIPVYLFIPLMAIISIIVAIPLAFVIVPIFGPMGTPYDDRSFWYMLIVACAIAPVFETAVFQSIPIYALKSFRRLSDFWIIIISASLFGMEHYFSVAYVIFSFIVGLLLAYSYLIYLKKGYSAFFVVAAIHCLRNLFSLFWQFGWPLISQH